MATLALKEMEKFKGGNYSRVETIRGNTVPKYNTGVLEVLLQCM